MTFIARKDITKTIVVCCQDLYLKKMLKFS